MSKNLPKNPLSDYPSIPLPDKFEDVVHWWFWVNLEASLRKGPVLPKETDE